MNFQANFNETEEINAHTEAWLVHGGPSFPAGAVIIEGLDGLAQVTIQSGPTNSPLALQTADEIVEVISPGNFFNATVPRNYQSSGVANKYTRITSTGRIRITFRRVDRDDRMNVYDNRGAF